MKSSPPKYTVAFTSDAKQDMGSLDGSIRKRLKKVLEEKISMNPSAYGTPLRGELTGYWKHEFVAHRVIYRIYEDRRLVVICAVGKRQGAHASDVYEQLLPMVKAGKVLEQVLLVLSELKAKR